MTNRVMIDIETLGVRNDAVVLSIAAQRFSFFTNFNNKLDVEFGVPGVWYPSLRQQFALGRSVSPGTLEWWCRDDLAQARLDWSHPPIPCVVDETLDSVYQGFAQYVESADEVWAHGVVFDVGILESLFDQIHEKAPWKSYSVVRDVRTLVRVLPKLRFSAPMLPPHPEIVAPKSHVSHNPVDDCVAQIWDMWSVWPEEGIYNARTVHPDINTSAIGH